MTEELGPGSQALLERVKLSLGYVDIGTLLSWARQKTGLDHSYVWWYRRLVALALEGRIEAKVHRTGDKIAIMFRRLQEADVELFRKLTLEEDVFVSAFRNQRDSFTALADLVETEDDDKKTESMILATRRLAEVCDMLANSRIEQLEAE